MHFRHKVTTTSLQDLRARLNVNRSALDIFDLVAVGDILEVVQFGVLSSEVCEEVGYASVLLDECLEL